ncbi:pollen receptor-like kinase 3 [Neltuma alba]|uniref:pollen receptor-like kinase 3 n=1 Tax=Neltuma alba TaxID=207710 RepID=UPI0010A3548F|nr:pollen receptor-like kinase 3 [Prosopis alba]XP_028796569.1 pollen receptor-like kinase 3 [Prosopis alba]
MAAVRLSLFFLFLLLTLPSFSSSSDTDALLKLKQSFTNSASLSSWVPNSSPCRWAGIMCDNNTIIGLHLSDMGLSGKIDIDAMLEIKGLRTVSLVNNSFSGPIPEFNKIGALKALYLSTNQFSGEIPSDFFSYLNSLKKIWLSENKFSGPIPNSISQLDMLLEIHLENNEFSGAIPPLSQSIKSLDMSNNNLEGPIPESLAKFEANSFKGNEGLCGKPLDKACDQQGESKNSSGHVMLIILFIVCLIIAVALFLVVRSRRRLDGDFSVLSRDSVDEVVQVHVGSSTESRESDSSGRGTGSKRGVPKSGNADLVVVNEEKGVFGLPDLMKAAAEVLGNGSLGSAYKAAMSNGLSVVVKRVRAINQIGRDFFDAEMRGFGRIKHANILTILAYHFRKEEKLIISEYMPRGSLLYVLHGDRGTSHADLTWPVRLKIIKGIAQGLRFLHSHFSSYDLPHGNLKSSNVLLTQDYEPLLSDYALHPLLNPNSFNALFAFKSPDYVQHQLISQKVDVYCLGIIILEILTGKFPSQYHSNGKGGTDVVQWVLAAISERREAEVIDPEMANTPNSLDQMLKILQVGAACTESNPEQRINLNEAIRRIEEVQV